MTFTTVCRALVFVAAILPLVAAATAFGDSAHRIHARGPGHEARAVAASSTVRTYVIRLRPGADLRLELLAWARGNGLRAGAVVSCAGSLSRVNLRYANQAASTAREGHFEIVSLSGTLDEGGGHLHLAVADSEGVVTGGHLWDGCRIYTTAEVVIAALPELEFSREVDSTYGYRELVVRKRSAP